ncbi:MAG: TonB-dependent receptor plug domain-containing protein [Bacteroidales bacterium]|nr:TonB-dependent receptor plug domain-containing protein [Bacteroidales bacterium]
MNRNYLLAAAAMTCLWAAASTPFNGIITRNDFTPMKGVKVYVTDPHKYSKTDKHGRFGLTDVAATDSLHIVVKKQTYVIPVDSARSMRIVVADEGGIKNAYEDPELVDMGYGFVSRREYNSPTSGISGDRLVATGRSDILDALVGLVPGLERKNNGTVQLRGANSLTGPTEPHYVVDGVIVPDFGGINIHQVESVEVLKDGSIYGSRGAGGAIIVKTKRGR